MKVPNIKFHGNMSSGSCDDMHKQTTGGLTDGHDEGNSCSSRLHELAKNWIWFQFVHFCCGIRGVVDVFSLLVGTKFRG